MQKTMPVSKEVLGDILDHIELLIDDFESLLAKDSSATLQKRLADVKGGKVKDLSEKDFRDFLRKEGINAG